MIGACPVVYEVGTVIAAAWRAVREAANEAVAVTMPERGISRVLTLNITEVEDRLGVKIK